MQWGKLLRELEKEVYRALLLPYSPVSEKQAREKSAESVLVKALGLDHLPMNLGSTA